ncbi:NU155 protein, partial [Polypterus senegalus]|nr:NU155 protein [Polypterus senegalus]
MQELVNQSKAAPQSPSVPKQPGPPVMSSDPNMLSNEDATAHFELMLELAQRSRDELFHIALYNWLIQADLTDKLLEVNSPYLEDHLMRMMKQDQNKVCYMDLLWRYYEKNQSFSKAAHVLARLADMHRVTVLFWPFKATIKSEMTKTTGVTSYNLKLCISDPSGDYFLL